MTRPPRGDVGNGSNRSDFAYSSGVEQVIVGLQDAYAIVLDTVSGLLDGLAPQAVQRRRGEPD